MKRIVLLLVLSLTLRAGPVSRLQDPRIGLRLIATSTQAEAASLSAQIQAGGSFEELAKVYSIDPSAKAGGFIGLLRPTDLRAEFQRALDGVAPRGVSAVIPLEGQFFLLQPLSLEEANWTVSNNAGFQALQEGRYDEAAMSFQQALQNAEKLQPVDYRLEDSLRGLAEAYRLQKKYAEAEPFYRRYLAIHWAGSSVPEVLDRFSVLVTLAFFRDAQFAETQRQFEEALDRAPLGEDLYQAMSSVFFKAHMVSEAQNLMLRAAQLLPASKVVRYHLGRLYESSMNEKRALGVFDELSRMKSPAPTDPDLDRLQQSMVQQKIGSIRMQIGDFDAALSAYSKALELTPESSEARLELGRLYLWQGKPEDALSEYNRVVAAEPQNAAAHFRIADAYLRIRNPSAAAAAAAKALSIDPGHVEARFVRAKALMRMGEKEEAERERELYRKLEKERRSETYRSQDIVALNQGAAAKMLEGRPEEAIAMFLKIIESYPNAPTTYFNLGTVQSKLGRHEAAVETFQKMITLGIDNFVVYRNLSEEYRVLGEMEASRLYEGIYLQSRDATLREAINWSLD